MPSVEDIVPQLPWKGPPLPEVTKLKWPLTLEDVEKAVSRYAQSLEKALFYYEEAIRRGRLGPRAPRRPWLAVRNFRLGIEKSIGLYRYRLLKALELGRW